MKIIYVQFEGMVYQQILGIPMGTNCAPLGGFVKTEICELPRFYWLPKLHKNPFKSRFILNSSHCSTTILSKHITSALTAAKDHVMKYRKRHLAIVM